MKKMKRLEMKLDLLLEMLCQLDEEMVRRLLEGWPNRHIVLRNTATLRGEWEPPMRGIR